MIALRPKMHAWKLSCPNQLNQRLIKPGISAAVLNWKMVVRAGAPSRSAGPNQTKLPCWAIDADPRTGAAAMLASSVIDGAAGIGMLMSAFATSCGVITAAAAIAVAAVAT